MTAIDVMKSTMNQDDFNRAYTDARFNASFLWHSRSAILRQWPSCNTDADFEARDTFESVMSADYEREMLPLSQIEDDFGSRFYHFPINTGRIF